MALGGGTFRDTNKSLPGAYINTVSVSKDINFMGENGVVAIAFEHDYGIDGEVITMTQDEFMERALPELGYQPHSEKLKPIRELFKYAKKAHIYVLNKNSNAVGSLGVSKKGGKRSAEITIKIQTNVDDPSKKDVITMLDYVVLDKQTVANVSELKPNDYLSFDETAELTDTAGQSLTDGPSHGETHDPTNEQHNQFLKKLETLNFNAICCMSTDKDVQKLYIAYTKRMRDELGIKFATVLCESDKAESYMYDYEGVVVVKNKVFESDVKGNELAPFTAGIYASAELGKSNLNRAYEGEYEVIADFTQHELKSLIDQGRFVYHKVGDTVRVLEDINGLISYNDEKSSDFRDNQVIRVTDALAISDAKVFNEMYLGKVNIDKAGIESFENKVIEVRDYFVSQHALEDYDKASVKVERVNTDGVRGAVKINSIVTPAECFRQLYLTNYVR